LHSAKQLISRHVITGFPEQRLTYLADKIQASAAQYCAVLRPRTFALLGLVRFSDVAANPGTATRIFSDLMHPPPSHQVYDFDPVEKVLELIEHDPSEIVVIQQSLEFVGLITPDSFIRWLLSVTPVLDLKFAQIPATSRWNPYPRR
jgi:hypothetical protein